MTKEELEKEIEDWWRIKFRVELKDDVCQKLTTDEAKELCNKIAEPREKRIEELEKENAELRKVAEFQQSSNMNTHLENKKLKEGLAVGSTWNKHLNSLNKALEEERDKYRNMVFDQKDQLAKAKDHIKKLLGCLQQDTNDPQTNYYVVKYMTEAEQFLREVEK